MLSESVVWLYANNRVAEAERIIRNAANLNNIIIPEKILAQHDIGLAVTANGKMDCGMSDDESRKFLNNFRRSEKGSDRSTGYTIVDIFRNRHLTINIVCVSLLWSVRNVIIC